MAQKILFKVTESPSDLQNPFSGRMATNNNPNFGEDGCYQEAFKFEEKSELQVDGNNNVQGIRQSPFLIWKSMDIDTPSFKECLIRNLEIGEISFHFFHTRGADTHLINHFTIILKKVKVIESQILLFDISDDTPEERSPNFKLPYIEQLKLTASNVTWKYSRTSEPRKATKTTVFNIGN
ncbi:hypothetical protein MHK_006554 [Candidatus Magnetomorum sp. HK-1]|nr:hypothetical protein MHK_006554 [Candidatus Magnetomorum sp. HK-1]